VVLLGFGDSGLTWDLAPGTLAAAATDDTSHAVRRVVTAVDPDLLVTLDGGDGHRDHVAIRDATLAVARERGLPAYLHGFPRSLMRRWADHMATVQPDLAYLQHTDLGTPDEEVTWVLDTGAFVADREHAIAAHASQTSPFEGLPDDLRLAFLGQEHLVAVDIRIGPVS